MEERLSVLSPAPIATVPTTVAPGITGSSSVSAPVLPVSAVASLGLALPVPPRIQDLITRGGSIVFDELLTESLAAQSELHLALAGDGLVKIDRATMELKRKVCNLQTWLEAWTVYSRILCVAAAERIRDLLFYKGTIVEASSKYSSDAWLSYDRRFRMALAAQPHAFSWRTIGPNFCQPCTTAKAFPVNICRLCSLSWLLTLTNRLLTMCLQACHLVLTLAFAIQFPCVPACLPPPITRRLSEINNLYPCILSRAVSRA